MNSAEKLCIFHIDLNYSCLREDYLRGWLEKIAAAGYNAVLWEMEDKVQLETCPECIWPEAYTKETFKDILAFSRTLGLEPIPLLQTIGHAEYILMHEEYAHLRESHKENEHDCYCTENPEVRKFLKKLICEYIDLFGDIRFFHLGGDEAYVFGTCPECAEKVKRTGKNALYMEHVADISTPVRAAGIRPGIWGDMILHYPEDMEAIPKDYIIWDWNYWDSDAVPEQILIWGGAFAGKDSIPAKTVDFFPEVIDADGKLRPFYTTYALKRMGYDVILCSAIRAAGDSVFFPDRRRAANAVGAARVSARLELTGNCVTSWAIRLNPYEAQEHLIPLAPAVMRNPGLSLADAQKLVSKNIFGIESNEFFEPVETAGKNIPPFICSGSMAVQWNRLKDSLPAPRGHLGKLLAKWRNDDDGKSFEHWENRLENAERDILQALPLLSSFALKAEKGFETLDCWFDALIMQLWMIRIGKMIFEDKVTPETVNRLQSLRKRTLRMISMRETPRSARKNTALVFDWLIEYCRNAKNMRMK